MPHTPIPSISPDHSIAASPADFPTDPAHLVGTPSDPSYLDPGATGTDFYKVVATDVHGNSGPSAVLEPATQVKVPGASVALALRGPMPNPSASARMMIAFSLPNASAAALELFDATGRRVAERAVGALGAGSHLVNLAEGRALQPGLYAVRLTQGERRLRSKAIVTR